MVILIGTYTHSDRIRKNKVGCMVKIKTQTDFCANTDEVIEIANKAARILYPLCLFKYEENVDSGIKVFHWGGMYSPEVEDAFRDFLKEIKADELLDEMEKLSYKMKEEILLEQVVCMI